MKLVRHIEKLILVSFVSLFFCGGAFAQGMNHKNHHQMNDSTLMHRQQMIHQKSHMVMPFDMNKVTHYFLKNDEGGVLMIKSKDPTDTAQISLIREHLKKEKDLFSRADFKDPKTLHGMNMPGLKTLSKSANKFQVDYQQLADGAELKFTAVDANVIHAIHTWFDAQLKDHGKDAKSEVNQ